MRDFRFFIYYYSKCLGFLCFTNAGAVCVGGAYAVKRRATQKEAHTAARVCFYLPSTFVVYLVW